jgi:hypothetical protein
MCLREPAARDLTLPVDQNMTRADLQCLDRSGRINLTELVH